MSIGIWPSTQFCDLPYVGAIRFCEPIFVFFKKNYFRYILQANLKRDLLEKAYFALRSQIFNKKFINGYLTLGRIVYLSNSTPF